MEELSVEKKFTAPGIIATPDSVRLTGKAQVDGSITARSMVVPGSAKVMWMDPRGDTARLGNEDTPWPNAHINTLTVRNLRRPDGTSWDIGSNSSDDVVVLSSSGATAEESAVNISAMIAPLERRVATVQALVSSSDENFVHLQDEINSVKSSCADTSSKTQSLEQKVGDVTAAASRIGTELSELQETTKALLSGIVDEVTQRVVVDCEQRVTQTRSQDLRRVEQRVDQIECFTNSIKLSGLNLPQIGARIEVLESSAARLQEQIVTVTQHKEAQDVSFKKLINDAQSSLKSDLTATNANLASTKEDLAAIKTDLVAAKTNLDATKTELDVAKTDLVAIKEDLAAVKSVAAKLNLSDYATKDELINYVTKDEMAASKVDPSEFLPKVDLSGYVTKDELAASKIDPSEFQPKVDLSGYVTKDELAATNVDLSGYVTKDELAATNVDLSGYVTKDELVASNVDLSGYVTKDELAATNSGYVTKDELAATNSVYVTKDELAASNSVYVTKDELVASNVDLSGYVTKDELAASNSVYVTKDELVASNVDLSGYVTKDELAATNVKLSRYATKKDISEFLTEGDLYGFATKEDLSMCATKEDLSMCATKIDLLKFVTHEEVSGLVTRKEVSGLVTREEVSGLVQRDEIINYCNRVENCEKNIHSLQQEISDCVKHADINMMVAHGVQDEWKEEVTKSIRNCEAAILNLKQPVDQSLTRSDGSFRDAPRKEDLIPDKASSRTLGSASMPWKSFYSDSAKTSSLTAEHVYPAGDESTLGTDDMRWSSLHCEEGHMTTAAINEAVVKRVEAETLEVDEVAQISSQGVKFPQGFEAGGAATLADVTTRRLQTFGPVEVSGGLTLNTAIVPGKMKDLGTAEQPFEKIHVKEISTSTELHLGPVTACTVQPSTASENLGSKTKQWNHVYAGIGHFKEIEVDSLKQTRMGSMLPVEGATLGSPGETFSEAHIDQVVSENVNPASETATVGTASMAFAAVHTQSISGKNEVIIATDTIDAQQGMFLGGPIIPSLTKGCAIGINDARVDVFCDDLDVNAIMPSNDGASVGSEQRPFGQICGKVLCAETVIARDVTAMNISGARVETRYISPCAAQSSLVDKHGYAGDVEHVFLDSRYALVGVLGGAPLVVPGMVMFMRGFTAALADGNKYPKAEPVPANAGVTFPQKFMQEPNVSLPIPPGKIKPLGILVDTYLAPPHLQNKTGNQMIAVILTRGFANVLIDTNTVESTTEANEWYIEAGMPGTPFGAAKVGHMVFHTDVKFERNNMTMREMPDDHPKMCHAYESVHARFNPKTETHYILVYVNSMQ